MSATTIKPLTDDDIAWEMTGGAPWPESETIIDTAIKALPVITDPLAADLIEELLHTIVNLRERGQSLERLVLVGLDDWHRHALADHRRQRARAARREAAKRRPC